MILDLVEPSSDVPKERKSGETLVTLFVRMVKGYRDKASEIGQFPRRTRQTPDVLALDSYGGLG